jgi:uncharacterized protein YbjT (DUF2867 family)
MNIGITGATGFVGQEITRCLHSAGHSIRILARRTLSPAACELVERYRVEVRPGDILDPASLAGALQDTNAVIHLVGIISEAGKSTFQNVHSAGTENMIAAAQRAGVRRFIHMSALGTRPNAKSRYHQTKWAAEETVRNSGLDWTIFRPSLIYGPQDHFINLFAGIARFSPVVPILGSGRTRYAPVGVELVAKAFLEALTTTAAIGQTYDLCGPDTFTMGQILDEIFAVMNRKRIKLRIPLAAARCQARLLELLYGGILNKPPPLNRDQLIMLEEDNVGHGDPANRQFGLRHRPFRDGIAAYLDPLRESTPD